MNRAFHRTVVIAVLLTVIGAGPVRAQLLSNDEESPVGLTEDRDLLPEQESRGLQDQVNVGNVEDEQVLGDEEEGQPRGAGVGLREDESDMGEVPQLPPLGLERDD
jgi:hypothetical protein